MSFCVCIRRCPIAAGMLLWVLLVGTPFVSRADALSDVCRDDSLPPDVRDSLARNFSAFKIQTPANLVAGARESWAAELPVACPGIAVGHFENARQSSYAVLLSAVDHSSVQLVIFSRPAGLTVYGFKLVDQWEESTGDVFIRAVGTAQFVSKQGLSGYGSRLLDSVLLENTSRERPQTILYTWLSNGLRREPVNPK